MKTIKEKLYTAFNFDDIVDKHLDDIKTEPTKNSADSVKHRWLYPKLALLVSEVLNDNKPILTLKEQNSLFEDCIKCDIYYLFPNNETFKYFIQQYCNTNTEANLNWINTSNITNMSNVFWGSKFNGDISQWDVSNVTDMRNMFSYANFDGDISEWDVSHTTDMGWMFYYSEFNGDISSWDVSNVKYMGSMFRESKFNGDISGWDVSSVTDMAEMFKNSEFNGDISSWDVSNVNNKNLIFYHCPIKNKYKPKFKK